MLPETLIDRARGAGITLSLTPQFKRLRIHYGLRPEESLLRLLEAFEAEIVAALLKNPLGPNRSMPICGISAKPEKVE